VNDAALVGRLLDEYHERSVAPAGIRRASGSVHEPRVTYLVTLPDGRQQVIRAFRADEPVPVHGRGLVGEPVSDWLLGRASTLSCLAAAGYSAPRPILTRTGELVGVERSWLSWATSYVPGDVLVPTLSQLRALGAALGSLHSVASDLYADGGPGMASGHPAVAVPVTLARLDAVAGRVPADWQPMFGAFRQSVMDVQQAAEGLPETLVHGDAWARNAVQHQESEEVILIDWETGGRGLAVIDLGNCLVECHLDSALRDDRPQGWLITPDEKRIGAVASGYASCRSVSPGERALLPAAMTFSAAVVGAIHLELALISGVRGPVMDARLARLQNRVAVAGEVAALALPHLGG
jgi:Ser/Thr protein kinase RdoA (MazF antagonist)